MTITILANNANDNHYVNNNYYTNKKYHDNDNLHDDNNNHDDNINNSNSGESSNRSIPAQCALGSRRSRTPRPTGPSRASTSLARPSPPRACRTTSPTATLQARTSPARARAGRQWAGVIWRAWLLRRQLGRTWSEENVITAPSGAL